MKRIFLLDDDELVLDSFAMIFGDLGYEVVTESNGQRAIETVASQDFDLVLTDIRMPALNGADAVRAIMTKRPDANIYVITAYPGDPMVKLALDAGAKGVMRKPFEIGKILDILKE
jgi:CheY-like chemotaxis protein